jgi:hypothetical protein
LDGVAIDRAANVSLVEESDDLVAGLEARHILADCQDGAGAVRAGNDVGGSGEGIMAERDDEVTVLRRC